MSVRRIYGNMHPYECFVSFKAVVDCICLSVDGNLDSLVDEFIKKRTVIETVVFIRHPETPSRYSGVSIFNLKDVSMVFDYNENSVSVSATCKYISDHIEDSEYANTILPVMFGRFEDAVYNTFINSDRKIKLSCYRNTIGRLPYFLFEFCPERQ